MRTPWEIAIESKDDKKIREVLAGGYVPENLQELITVEISRGNEVSVSIIEILLWGDRTTFLKISEKFLGLGASLPEQRKNRSDFSAVSEYLQHLAHSQHDLFIALRTDPNLMNLRGGDQETLLHHAARVGVRFGWDSAWMILSQVLLPTANFQVQDRQGITPLHEAAACSHEKVTRQLILPSFITAAIKSKKGFDFETKDYRGDTFLDVVKIMASQRISNVDHYIKSLQFLRMKPFAEVRKNTRVLLGPKKPGKGGTLSVLPLEILMMILEKTNDVFNEIEGDKRRKLILEYGKRPKIPSKMSMAITNVSRFLNDGVGRLAPLRENFAYTAASIFANMPIFIEVARQVFHARQVPQVQEAPRALTRFAQIQNTMTSIAMFGYFTQMLFATIGSYVNNDSSIRQAGSLPSTASFEERFRESPFIFSMQMLAGILMMLACAMALVEQAREQLPHVQNFLVTTRDRVYAFWNEVGGANNPARHAMLDEVHDALVHGQVNHEGDLVLH